MGVDGGRRLIFITHPVDGVEQDRKMEVMSIFLYSELEHIFQ